MMTMPAVWVDATAGGVDSLKLAILPSGRQMVVARATADAGQKVLTKYGFSPMRRPGLYSCSDIGVVVRMLGHLTGARTVAFSVDRDLVELLPPAPIAAAVAQGENSDPTSDLDPTDAEESAPATTEGTQALDPNPLEVADQAPSSARGRPADSARVIEPDEAETSAEPAGHDGDPVRTSPDTRIEDVGDVRGLARKDYARIGAAEFFAAVHSMGREQALDTGVRDVFWPAKSDGAHKKIGRTPAAAAIYNAVQRAFQKNCIETGRPRRAYHYSEERFAYYAYAIRWAREHFESALTLQDAEAKLILLQRAFYRASVTSLRRVALDVQVRPQLRLTTHSPATVIRFMVEHAPNEELRAAGVALDVDATVDAVGIGDSILQPRATGGRRVRNAPPPILDGSFRGDLESDFMRAIPGDPELIVRVATEDTLPLFEALNRIVTSQGTAEQQSSDVELLTSAGLHKVIALEKADGKSIGELLRPVTPGLEAARALDRSSPTWDKPETEGEPAVVDERGLEGDAAGEPTESQKNDARFAELSKASVNLRSFMDATLETAGRMASRSGQARRDRDATGQDLLDTFGFRGIEYGNWLPQGERQQHLNLLYDSFMDLSDALGLPPTALSLGGSLGIALGSRGRGGKRAARAHYEPSNKAINITRMDGAGALAHEWAHALDHYLSPDGMAPYSKTYSAEFLSDIIFRRHEVAIEMSPDPARVLSKDMRRPSSGVEEPKRWNQNRHDPTRPPPSEALVSSVSAFMRSLLHPDPEQYSDAEIDRLRLMALVNTAEDRKKHAEAVMGVMERVSAQAPHYLRGAMRKDPDNIMELATGLSTFATGEASALPAIPDLPEDLKWASRGHVPEDLQRYFKSYEASSAVMADPASLIELLDQRVRLSVKNAQTVHERAMSRGVIPSLSAAIDKIDAKAFNRLDYHGRTMLRALEGLDAVQDFEAPAETEAAWQRAVRWAHAPRDVVRSEIKALKAPWLRGLTHTPEQAELCRLLPGILSKQPQWVSQMMLDADALDCQRRKSYWSLPHELFARGFEAAITQRLAQLNIHNSYLSSAMGGAVVEFEDEAAKRFYGERRFYLSRLEQMERAMRGSPYPSSDNLSAVEEALANMANSMQTIVLPRPDAHGEHHDLDVLYSRDVSTIAGLRLSDFDYEVMAEEAKADMERMLGDTVPHFITEKLRSDAAGVYLPRILNGKSVIMLAMSDRDGHLFDLRATAAHESMHAAMDLLYTPAERMILERAFSGPGKPWFMETVLAAGRLPNKEAAHAIINEIHRDPREAVAYAFQFHTQGLLRPPHDRNTDLIDRLLDRFALFCERAANLIRGYGFVAPVDLMDALSRGGLKQRVATTPTAEAQSVAVVSETPSGLPHQSSDAAAEDLETDTLAPG